MKLTKWAFACFLLTASVANAAFIGSNVSGYGNGYVDVIHPDQFTLYSSNLEDGQELSSSYLYTDVATSDIKVSFNWLYQTFDEDGSFDDASWTDPAGYIVNGVKVQLNQVVLSEFGTESGIGSFNVAAGSTFGFYADTDDNAFGGSLLKISNLSITPVPEPKSYTMLLIGFALLNLLRVNKPAKTL